MPDAAIQLDQVHKRFRRGSRHDSLRDWLAATLRSPLAGVETHPDDFWAVKDISLSIRPGEAFGIIGPNGAGKSTLLKLLAGILRPTKGTIFVRGRVSALIELGAGFHGDLTGREHVYLNASILGMSRREARRTSDEIVGFAGIEAAPQLYMTDEKGTPVAANAQRGIGVGEISPGALFIGRLDRPAVLAAWKNFARSLRIDEAQTARQQREDKCHHPRAETQQRHGIAGRRCRKRSGTCDRRCDIAGLLSAGERDGLSFLSHRPNK